MHDLKIIFWFRSGLVNVSLAGEAHFSLCSGTRSKCRIIAFAAGLTLVLLDPCFVLGGASQWRRFIKPDSFTHVTATDAMNRNPSNICPIDIGL